MWINTLNAPTTCANTNTNSRRLRLVSLSTFEIVKSRPSTTLHLQTRTRDPYPGTRLGYPRTQAVSCFWRADAQRAHTDQVPAAT
eukprot:534882-Rhodomonas_salina.1